MARRVRVPLALAALLLAVAAPLAATAAKTHYEVLGVARDATLKDIRSAYRAKSLETHPDKGGSPEAFLEVAQAYEALGDEDTRRRYDQRLKFSDFSGGDVGGGAGGGSSGGRRRHGEYSGKTRFKAGMSQEELLREAMSQFESFVDKVFSDGTIDELIDRAVDAATYGSSGEKPGFFSGGISGLMKRGTNAAMKGTAKSAWKLGGNQIRGAMNEALKQGNIKLSSNMAGLGTSGGSAAKKRASTTAGIEAKAKRARAKAQRGQQRTSGKARAGEL